MNLNKFFRRLMDAADDAGGTGTGGAADRGDTFVPLDSSADESLAAAAVADLAAEEAAALTAADEAAEQARTADGKFAKKEKDADSAPVIPKARFDEQIGKERQRAEAAERRAAELEAATAKNVQALDIQKSVADVAELRKQERKALLDGNDDKAAELSAQADALNRRIAIAESGALTAEAKDQALEDMRFDLTIERMEEKYPALRVGDEAYDQDLIDDILDKQRGLIDRLRLPPSKALAQAVEHVMSRRAPAAAAAEEKPAAGLAGGKDEIGDRKAAAVAKNLAAAAAQPGSLKDAGLDSDKAGQTKPLPSVNDMTYEEFNALPEATRAKMRGDFS